MNASRLFKWVLFIAVVLIAWKVVLPKLRDKKFGSSTSSSSAGGSVCAAGARLASNAWGSGIGRFVNPPYDADDWSQFRDDVNAKISAAEGRCRGTSDAGVRDALQNLRGLVSDVDNAVRNGTPPPVDLAQRQEAVDNAIDAAGGK